MILLKDDLEIFKSKKTISYLYIKDGKLKATYHLDDKYNSYWEESFYYNWNEVWDTFDIEELFELDYRERDYTQTLNQKNYFLVWESKDFFPEYLKKFLLEYQEYLISNKIKIIKRTNWNKNLIFLNLNIHKKDIYIPDFSNQIKNILNK